MSAPGCNMADVETRFPPPPPRRNGLYIVSGELSQVVGAMRRSTRHSRAQVHRERHDLAHRRS